MKNMPTGIAWFFSKETVGLLLWNSGTITHIAEYYITFDTVHRILRKTGFFLTEYRVVKPKCKNMQHFQDDWHSIDMGVENFVP